MPPTKKVVLWDKVSTRKRERKKKEGKKMKEREGKREREKENERESGKRREREKRESPDDREKKESDRTYPDNRRFLLFFSSPLISFLFCGDNCV